MHFVKQFEKGGKCHSQQKDFELTDASKLPYENHQVSQIIAQVSQIKVNYPSHTYRPDIDGLRTIAIFTVVIYHAFPNSMPGGFIGVDVFFVISGYLISQIIIKETRQNRFSYANFYSRRVKRIYPALLLILIYVLYMVTKYYRYDQLGFTLKTLSASTVFGANFQVLAHEKGYFDPQIHVNPLLHLWSLGVQQQFYIFWPCLISIGLNVFKKRTFLVLALYTALSFIFGIVCVYSNPKFAFYFPVCRFWQMAVGGLIAYFSLKIQNTKINNALSIIGTLSILLTVWIINDESLFPGFWALIPTLASTCIIQSGPKPFINKHILSSKVFVFVGKISYPMYLWHWPLLVFSRYFYPQGSTSIFSNLYLIIAITVMLSVLTYYFVENPIRKIKTKKIAIVLFIIILIVGALSYWSLVKAREREQLERLHSDINYILAEAQKQMIPRPEDFIEKNGRMHPNLSKSRNRKTPTVDSTQVAIKDYLNDRKIGQMILDKQVTNESKYYQKVSPVHAFQVENEGKQNQVFFIGDSHALRIGYHFQQLYRNSVAEKKADSFPTVVGLAKMGIPLIGQNSTLFNFTTDLMKKHKPKRLLLAFHWLIAYCNNVHTDEPICRYQQFDIDLKILQQFIKEAQSLGVEVSSTTIALDHPNFHTGNMIDANGIIEQNLKPVNLTWYRNKHKKMIDKLQTALRNANAQIIDLTDNLCYEGMCEVTSPSGQSVYYDSHHHGKFYSRHWLSVIDHLVQF